MMAKKVVFVFCVSLVLLGTGCNKSEDEGSNKAVISDNTVESADVNNPNYWDTVDLVWNDEFDGASLNKDKWLFETFDLGPSSTELQTYVVNDNVEVSGGTLKILAKKVGQGNQRGDYATVRLNGKFAFKYGRMEVRARMPEEKGNGLWAKLWMLGNNIGEVGFPLCGEIDLAEYVSLRPNFYYNTLHTQQVPGSMATTGAMELTTVEEEFHTYGILWTHEYVKFYLDDIDNITYAVNRQTNFSAANWPFQDPFYFLMSMVVGGQFWGAEGVDESTFPNAMEIDYVRVYHAR